MSSPSSTAQSEPAPWPALAAALVPFVLYVWTAGGTPYWLDSAEFTAAAIDLDIAHPPGAPLASLWGKLFTLLPWGPLPFRVALGQAAACALALACVQRAVERSVGFLGLRRTPASLMGIGSAWLLGASYGFWFQAVRAEVYGLQALLVCFALERLTVLATHVPSAARELDARPFYQATLAIGFGLANHHFISVLALPGFAWAFVQLTRQQGARPLVWGLATGLVGLSAYVYLPLRAARLPPMDLGHPVSADALAWVVSAQVYTRRVGSEALQPLGERFADLLVIMVENLGPLVLLLLWLGSYALVRTRASWPLAFLWLTSAFVNLAGRAFLNEVRANPDVLGYMMPGFAASFALAAAGLSTLALSVAGARFQRGVALVWLGLGALQLAQGAAQPNLARFQAPDLFDEVRYRGLPKNACLVLLEAQTAFRHFGAEAAERLRPDVAMVPVPFLDYGGAGEQLARKRPELAPLIRTYLERQLLSPTALQALALRRPVLVELDSTLTLPLYDRLIPSGLYYELLPRPASERERSQAAQERDARFTFLYAALGADAQELETRRQLLWLHYTDALFLAHHGLRDQAHRAAKRGLALVPEARELGALDEALGHGEGPLDIQPFLVGSP